MTSPVARCVLAVVSVLLAAAVESFAANVPSFSRDVLPIFSDNCFACHGPDAKQGKGGLRLDLHDSATRPAKSGAIAIVPGQLKQSELLRRILTSDDADLMPPPDSHKPRLTAAQANTMQRWIEAGSC